MSELEQAVNERIEEFRVKILEMKRLDGMTINDMAETCEVGRDAIASFLSNAYTPKTATILKISFAMGVQL